MGLGLVLGAALTVFAFLPDANAAEFDRSFLPVCKQLAAGTPVTDIESHTTVRKLKLGFGEQFKISPEVVRSSKGQLHSFMTQLDALEASLPSFVADATIFTGPAIPDDLKINLVCGTHSDGYGFKYEGSLELFLDLTRIDPDFLPHLLRHELWHVAFRTAYPETETAYDRHDFPYKRLAFVMLNEGVGHYYSFRRRVEPEVTYADWPERTDAVFSLLEDKFQKYRAASKMEDHDRLLWSSHAGVPFWKKWAAVPGAVITYRLRKQVGDDALRELIAAGPCAFLSRYQTEAHERADWQPLPPGLVEAACPASKADR